MVNATWTWSSSSKSNQKSSTPRFLAVK
jgi:hypothetical protein